MEKKKYSELCKWVLFYALCTVGFIAFMFLCGEEDPNSEPLPLGIFFLYKLGSLALIYLCVQIGKKLHAAGMLPKKIDEELEEDDV